MGLGGQPLGAVRLHQHEIRRLLPAVKRRRRQLPLRRQAARTGHAARCQRRLQLLRRLGEGILGRAHDVGGGGQQHCAVGAQLLRQLIQQAGLAAAAYHRRHAFCHAQYFPQFLHGNTPFFPYNTM